MSLAASLFAGGLFAQWIDFEHSLHAQHVCSKAAGLCRTVAHAVFVVGPELHDGHLDRLNITGLDGAGLPKPLGYTDWENHVVNGVCGDPGFKNCTGLPGAARVYNWGYEAWQPFTPKEELAKSISPVVSIKDGAAAATLLPKVTIPFVTSMVSGKNNSKVLRFLPNILSTCAYQDGGEVIFHVVFSVAPVDDPIENLTATGQYTMDSGKSWHVGHHIFFEDHIDLKNGTYFQSFQFDGRWKGIADNVCFRVVVSDNQQRRVKYGNCMKVCDSIVPFHNAAGYCPSPHIVV